MNIYYDRRYLMDNIIDVIFGCIKAQICGQTYIVNKNISDAQLGAIYQYTKAHDMAHIVASELMAQNILKDNEIGNRFKKQQILAIYRYERINYEFGEICRVLNNSHIPYIPLKGAVMRRYYPEEWMRTSADIDILVKQEDISAAADALVKELQYKNDGIAEHDIQMFSQSGVHLELHFDTVEDYRAANANAILKNIWNGYCAPSHGCCYEMSNEMFYFYHIAHMAKHFEASGCGIRFFLDLWLLRQAMVFDEQKKQELLISGGLLEFAQGAEKLSDVWFGNCPHTELTKQMESFVFTGGIYGSTENNMAIRHVKEGGKLGYATYLIFRPLNELKRQYPILNRHKILYPACQVHRWLCLIFNGGIGRAMNILNRSAAVYEESGDRVAKMLEELNLTPCNPDSGKK